MPTYSKEEKALAKSLVVAYDSPDRALTMLREVWGEEHSPSVSSLIEWRQDHRISLRQDLIDEINQQTRQRMIKQAGELADKVHRKVLDSIDSDHVKSGDVKNFAIGWAIFADKILGSKYSPGITVNAGPGSNTFVTFGPAPQQVEAPRDERIIDLE